MLLINYALFNDSSSKNEAVRPSFGLGYQWIYSDTMG